MVLHDFNLVQRVDCATHLGPAGNLLDLLIYHDRVNIVRRLEVIDVGVADHCLLQCELFYPRPPSPTITFEYRKLDNITEADFVSCLASSQLVSGPASTVHEYAEQMRSAIVNALDQLAPIRQSTKRAGKPVGSWSLVRGFTCPGLCK